MTLLLQRFFDALSNGAVYASLAVALTMVYRASGVLNLAQGEMAMVSVYIAALLHHDPDQRGVPFRGSGLFDWLGTPWPTWAAIVGAVLFGALLGAVVQHLVIEPLDRNSALPAIGAVVGLYLLLRGLAQRWWGGLSRPVGSPFPHDSDDRWLIFGARFRYETLGTVVVLLGVLVLLMVFQQRTKYGLAFRALVSNPEGAALMGIRATSVLMVGWAIASALGALGGGLIAGTLHARPDMMARLLVFALAAAILGGLGKPAGAVVGGFVFALAETMLVGYVNFITADIALVYTLGILILVLVVRPGGILGSDVTAERGRA